MDIADFSPAFTLDKNSKGAIYELRTYTTNVGKLNKLDARFADHTISIFKKHGMESVAYWHPSDSPRSSNTLIYLLKHENRSTAAASWKAFLADPQWKKVAAESQKDGRFLAKNPEAIFMMMTDYSPVFSLEKSQSAKP